MGDLSRAAVVLDLTGRSASPSAAARCPRAGCAAFLDEGALVRVVAPWLCEDLADLAVAPAASSGCERDYAGAADLDGAWFVHTATGEPSVDREVAADAEALRVVVRRRRPCRSGRPRAPPPAPDVTTPDGRVTVAAYAAGDPGSP